MICYLELDLQIESGVERMPNALDYTLKIILSYRWFK